MYLSSNIGGTQMITQNPKVDNYINEAKQWQEEYRQLRSVMQAFELVEDIKWGVPCYTLNGNNVALIHGFKEYCAVLFVKGALLKDASNILIQQTENVQAGRQVRFKNVEEIFQIKPVLVAYLKEAIDVEKAGLKVELKKNIDLVYPDEFQRKLDEMPSLKIAFDALTPGRKRAYNLYFSSAKQSITRVQRIEKYIPNILEGKGIDD